MQVIKNDFNQKINNAKDFLSFIKSQPNRGPVLKSSMILILYNILESSMVQLLTRVHDELMQHEFRRLKDNIQYKIVSFHVEKKRAKLILDVILEKIIKSEFYLPNFDDLSKNKTIFSGNVDNQKIQEIFKEYGIKVLTCEEKKDLVKIKNARNKLAHGEQTFEEFGKNISDTEIEGWLLSAEKSISQAIENIEFFIIHKNFLR